jgi:hypothetical protein
VGVINGDDDHIAIFKTNRGKDGAMLQLVARFVVLGLLPSIASTELVRRGANEAPLIQN